MNKNEADLTSQFIMISSTKRDNKIPTCTEGENLKQVTAELLKETSRYNVNPENISYARRIGTPPPNNAPDQRNILFKFSDKELKKDVLQAHINQRFSSSKGLFLNELLTNEVNNLYYYLRKAKKDHPDKIKSLYTNKGVIRIKLHQYNNTMEVFDNEDFNYVLNFLGISANNHVQQ